jgi:CBS domain-containing protein
MGFGEVYDFVGGKLEWLAHALPVEGVGPHHAVAGDVVDRDVVTCGPRAIAREIRATLEEREASRCVIVNDAGVVVGRVRRENVDGASDLAEALEPGPATVQLTEPLGPLTDRMEAANVDRILVTTPRGVLLGEVQRARARAFLDSRACCEPGRHPRR